MTTKVQYDSKAGGKLDGAVAEPEGTGKAGAVVVLQEWHGLNDTMRTLCDRFAQAGFVALVPDLYHGKIATDDSEAGKLMGGLDWGRAVAEIGDAVAFLQRHPRGNGKVAITGFCMGGALTFAAARHLEGLAAAVPFYGVPQLPMAEYARVKTPIQAHFAQVDDWAKASIAEEIQKNVRAGGGHMDLFVYDAGHAFMRASDASKYSPENAKLAWERAVDFLKKHLA
ncbi:MAG TPA: dienelactone hydrolase family protein [Polyangiaceae bacterium]|jgi:carboxymethylenebutenolidase